MTSNGSAAARAAGAEGHSAEPAEIDTSVAHAARVYDYLLGGKASRGVVQTAHWRPDPGAATPPSQVWVGAGRKAA